jgi:hypothetical protein
MPKNRTSLGETPRSPKEPRSNRYSPSDAYSTTLFNETVAALPDPYRDHFQQLLDAYRRDYRAADSIEDDLLIQLAFNRTRYFRYIRLEFSAGPRELPFIATTIERLDRAYHRILKTLEERRITDPQLAAPSKIIVEWIDPRTGKPWVHPDRNRVTEEQEEQEEQRPPDHHASPIYRRTDPDPETAQRLLLQARNKLNANLGYPLEEPPPADAPPPR